MNRKQKRSLCTILAAAALFIVALLLPVEGIWELIIYLIPYGLIGWKVIWKAIKNISRGQVFDENFLMCVASIGAMCAGEYKEAVAVMLFYQVGELFESCAVGKSRRSIAALMDIRPDVAHVERDGALADVDPEEVEIGERIVVQPGERVPLDGEVIDGTSTLDTAALTGESVPREIHPGEDVISGCINLSGVLHVRVNKRFGESTVARILELVENASSNKAKSENFITKFARWYTPAVCLAALLLAVVPSLITGDWGEWVSRALIFLVVSCPCALVISVPLSFFGGIGGASANGILIKGGNFVETLAQVDTVVFDKTGTLTQGNFEVTAIHPEKVPEQELLEIAALAENYSTHPISASLKRAFGLPLDESRISNVEELSGKGVIATVDGRNVAVGNGKLMQYVGVDWHECENSGTIVHVAADGAYMGHIVISDMLKPQSKAAIQALKDCGVKYSVMLTGDRRDVAEAVARELGVDGVYSELLPADKVAQVEKLLATQQKGEKLAFVGDGINDAPVLSRADVGVAMGALGSDAAIEAADVVL
ncbi:MAG: heavy metal translocating P-type ATPase, partial [Clostridia bacterium]|nr:heavy metal translocating P-type ATPase [Clostridia bacterium]